MADNFDGRESLLRRSTAFLPNLLINIFAIAILALMTVIAFNFDIDYILSWGFYITSLLLILVYTTTHWSWFDSKLKSNRKKIENKIIHKEKETIIKGVVNTVEWQRNRYQFINERNENELIKAWRIVIQNRLVRLQNNAHSKDLMIESANITDLQKRTLAEEKIIELQQKYADAKAKNKYCIKKSLYEEKLTDQWILENKNKIMVDYNKIDIQFVETGSVIKGVEKDKTNPSGKYAKDTMPNRFLSFLITFFITAFATDLIINGGTADAWINFGFRMLLLLMNMVTGTNYADLFYEDVDIHNDDSRVSITKEFQTWGLNKGIFTIKGEN